jgi:hypothetical protein
MVGTSETSEIDKADRAWHRHPILISVVGALATAVTGAVVAVVLGQNGKLPEAVNPGPLIRPSQ